MKIKTRRSDSLIEKQIVTGMISSKEFLRDIRTIFNYDYLKIPYARTIAEWCIDFYEKYEDAPKTHIEDIYKSHEKNNTVDSDQMDLIGSFLQNLSNEFEKSTKKFNIDYFLKKTETRFKQRSLENLCLGIQEALKSSNLTVSERLIANFNRVQIPKSNGVNPFSDINVVFDAFENNTKPLFKLPGAIGDLVNGDLCRGSFVSFMGPEKIGKTWLLMEISLRAYNQGCKVAFFQAGDMTNEQQIRRMHVRISGRSYKKKYCGNILIPVYDCFKNQMDECDLKKRKCNFGLFESLQEHRDCYNDINELKRIVKESFKDEYTPCSVCRKDYGYKGAVWFKEKYIEDPLTWRQAYDNGVKYTKRMDQNSYKVSTHENKSLSVSDIKTHLDIWERFDGFVPDVIITDYADIMDCEPQDRTAQFRHRENGKWQALRALSQNRNCVVITATQADAQSYTGRAIGLHNFTEDKRKYSHVTSMFSLQRNAVEKYMGIMRVGPLLMRDEDYDIMTQVKVMQSLKQGRAIIGSYK